MGQQNTKGSVQGADPQMTILSLLVFDLGSVLLKADGSTLVVAIDTDVRADGRFEMPGALA
jgi:hypothetical protein